MASGDTKTEALLNILGSGGDYSELSGSGNTKTQDYIIAAINKMEELEKKIDEGGGGGGGSSSMVLYALSDDFRTNGGTVILYTDIGLTTAVKVSEVHAALSEGKTLTVVVRSSSDGGSASRDTLVAVGSSYPKQCTSATMDDIGMHIYFYIDIDGVKETLECWDGPTADATFNVYRSSF